MSGLSWLQPGEGTEFPLRWQTRLRAWWEGYDVSGLSVTPAAPPVFGTEPDLSLPEVALPETSPEGEPLGLDGRPLWTADRLKVAEQLWGQDFTSPGGVEHATYLVKPFGINSKMSVLDMAAGLGGVARTIARDLGGWVTGLEASRLLAEIGNERSTEAGLGRHAPIAHYNPDDFKLDKHFDAIFAKEAFFTVRNKDALFDKIAEGLKSGGQLMFTDYGIGNTDLTDPAFVSWLSSEPAEPHLWSMDRTIQALRQRKLDVRINEDMTDLQRKLILGAMQNFTTHLAAHATSQSTKLAVLDEIELWARRVAAFTVGLRVFRFYCMKR